MKEMVKFAALKWISGKGIAFVGFAYLQGIALFALAYFKPDMNWVSFATALAAVNGPYYASGAWKASAEAKANGGTNGKAA
jgi:hypothetical protein